MIDERAFAGQEHLVLAAAVYPFEPHEAPERIEAGFAIDDVSQSGVYATCVCSRG